MAVRLQDENEGRARSPHFIERCVLVLLDTRGAAARTPAMGRSGGVARTVVMRLASGLVFGV